MTLGGRTVMFDCGMHVGYKDDRRQDNGQSTMLVIDSATCLGIRFPDFKLLSAAGRFSDLISCVIITHFHLDHCGALPYLTEVHLN